MEHSSKWVRMAVRRQITRMDAVFQKLCQVEPWEISKVVGKSAIQKTN